MKKILILLIILLSASNVVCVNDSIVNIHTTEISPEIVGGNNLIIPYFNYNDSYFSVKNNGHLSYNIYQYNYTGTHKTYKDSFIGVLNPDQVIMLNNNASYRFYASYDTIQDYTNVEKVKEKFNIWWVYVFIGVILFSIIVLGIKKVLRI